MATSASRRGKRLDVACVVLFLAAIYAPTVDLLVRDDAARGPGPELRNPAPKPGFPRTPKDYYKFPRAYEGHFKDTFGLRDKLLRWNSIERYFWLGTSPSADHVLGRDGWIYYGGDDSMEIVRGARPFTEEQLTDWQTELEERSKMHVAAGRRYLFTLAPNKESIYPERLPDSIRAVGPTRMDQFCAWMRARTNVDVLDLRPAFIAAKKDDTGPMDPLYTPHGTHWTARGVYVAYAAIVGHLALGTNSSGPRPLSDYTITAYPFGADSFANNLYLMDLLVQPGSSLQRNARHTSTVVERKDSVPRLVRTRGNESNLLPHAVVFHDSFGPFIAQTLADAFERLDMSESTYDRKRIDAKSTKIVVEMFVERYLRNHVPWPEPEPPLPNPDGSLAHTLFDLGATPNLARAIEGLGVTRTLDGGFRLERKSARDGFVAGPFRCPAHGEVRLFVDFEASAPGSLDVMWRRVPGEPFTRTARSQLPLGPGRDTREIAFPALGAECEIMLRPTEMEPAIVVHALTIKSEAAP